MRRTSKFILIAISVVVSSNIAFSQTNEYPNQGINQNAPPNYILPDISPKPLEPIVKPEPQLPILPQETPFETLPPENITDKTPIPTSDLPLESKSNSYLIYIVIVAGLAVGFFWKRLIELLKGKGGTKAEAEKEKNDLPAEAEKIPCKTCGGTGKIKKYQTKSVPCGHCKQTGIDICHHCSGTGKSGGGGFGVPLDDIENYPNDCPFCGGKGTPEIMLPCCMCKGRRKETYEEPYEVPCPTCKGSGLVNNY